MSNVPSLEEQFNFYNRRWKNDDFLNRLKLKRCISILGSLEKINFDHPYILELGCGTGWLSEILGNWGETTGIDLSSVAIEKAKKKYPNVNFIQSDVLSIDKVKPTFDVVISHEVLEHVEDQKQYIKIAYSFLKPGGYLILTTPNKKIFNAFSENQRVAWSGQPIENWLSIGELREMIKPEFSVIKLTTIIPGYDAAGVLRYLNSYSLRRIIKRFSLLEPYERFYLSIGFGLHLLLVAQKMDR